jgi:hypothetical protein
VHVLENYSNYIMHVLIFCTAFARNISSSEKTTEILSIRLHVMFTLFLSDFNEP